jgi:hypothetical protein
MGGCEDEEGSDKRDTVMDDERGRTVLTQVE